jgi:hypothetical protein
MDTQIEGNALSWHEAKTKTAADATKDLEPDEQESEQVKGGIIAVLKTGLDNTT